MVKTKIGLLFVNFYRYFCSSSLPQKPMVKRKIGLLFVNFYRYFSWKVLATLFLCLLHVETRKYSFDLFFLVCNCFGRNFIEKLFWESGSSTGVLQTENLYLGRHFEEIFFFFFLIFVFVWFMTVVGVTGMMVVSYETGKYFLNHEFKWTLLPLCTNGNER